MTLSGNHTVISLTYWLTQWVSERRDVHHWRSDDRVTDYYYYYIVRYLFSFPCPLPSGYLYLIFKKAVNTLTIVAIILP